MGDDRSIEDVLDTIGDEHARAVLAALSRAPASAGELTDRLDLSRPTVHRRLNTLRDHDLVTERTLVGDDGNHYKEYRCNFDSTLISLEGEEYTVRIFRRENLPNRFSRLWNDLSVEG